MPEVEPALRLAPLIRSPGGYQQRVGRGFVHIVGAGGQWGGDEEESHRHDA